jgi:primosomal protein N' (replication factor Y)
MSRSTQTSLFVEERQGEAGAGASVLVPLPVDRAYSYAVPDGAALTAGTYVGVSVGKRETIGVVWDEAAPDTSGKNIKSIQTVYNLPPLPAAHRAFVDWMAGYTMTERGAVLKMTLNVPTAFQNEKGTTGYRLKAISPTGRGEVVALMMDGAVRRASEIIDSTGCTAAKIKKMVKEGILETVEIKPQAPCAHPDPHRAGATLSDPQNKAAQSICAAVELQKYKAFLLDGVTGAGKTETYFEGVAAALKQDKQVLILLPEIALTNAFLDRFKDRFGCAPALWHSDLTPAQRRVTWRGVATGQTKVIVGARSALFLPFADLGLIVVDEEHDPAYKQEEGVMYHARDMAVARAHHGKIPVVLASATPSLETMANVWAGRYEALKLPDRHGGAKLPDVHIIDLRENKPERGNFIAPKLIEAVRQNLEANEQSLLFLNRRGYAPLTLCRSCGHRMDCPRCSAWLVEHRRTNKLHCHHCGYNLPTPKSCPSCKETDSFTACGPGVERIMEEVTELFPQARTEILASDTVEDGAGLRAMLDKIRNHEIDIIVGTQIIAKGHHFPNLTLVGVIDADLGLSGGELRAAERTYQLLHQVSGRAGREEKMGHVYLQTFMPENRVMKALAACDRDAFLEVEAVEREEAGMPPFSRLAGIIVSGRNEKQVEDAAKDLGRVAPMGEKIQVFGPAEAPFYRLRGNFRRRLLVRTDKTVNLQKAVTDWLAQVKTPSAVRVQVDIDPQGFL